jgi:cation diffusion facilitator CzcD-associated flavoprotein CzcO
MKADIFGLATAHKILTMNPGRKVLILEKEDTVGTAANQSVSI